MKIKKGSKHLFANHTYRDLTLWNAWNPRNPPSPRIASKTSTPTIVPAVSNLSVALSKKSSPCVVTLYSAEFAVRSSRNAPSMIATTASTITRIAIPIITPPNWSAIPFFGILAIYVLEIDNL